ncbi:tetratricopeptide repeat protein [Pyxidicoccus trucidator]|uniref:tetratricopeptide repeat protein n=1 Tax=Pyxidicoccus trucidator TaxID=2709662 RepID=UPI0013DB20DE|nr:bacterial transcriptional activator domain-containing protein [Pyxidicoccus trucidator]
MGERELMKLRELKEAAHALFARGRYAQCAETYERILRLAPKDPNVRVRHAEACRRAGDRQSAIGSYRAAAELLLAEGCESRARGALRAALELDPRDPQIHADLARMGYQATPSTALEDARLYSGATGFFERPGAASAQGAGSTTPRAPPGQAAPPPPPPPYVLRAAEATPVPGPLPSIVPTITPVNLDALRTSGRTMAPIPLTQPVTPGRTAREFPSLVPVVQGQLISETPVPPNLPLARTGSASARPTGATMAPVPSAARPAGVLPARPAGAIPPLPSAGRPTGATMAPVLHAARPAGATMAPVPHSARPAGATMAPVPPSGRPAGAPPLRGVAMPGQAVSSGATSLTMVPMPHAATASGGDARTPTQTMPYRPELRRLGPNAVALRVSPQARWVIIRSDSPLEVSRAETLPLPVEQQPGAAYASEPRSTGPTSVTH